MGKKALQPEEKRQLQETGREAGAPGKESPEVLLVPLDGSREAKVALPMARAVSQLIGGSVHVVYVDEMILSHRQLLQRLNLGRDEVHGLVFEQVSGPPAPAIIGVAVKLKASLIVMSPRGDDTPRERILSPVAEEILVGTPCPVLMVPPEAAPSLLTSLKLKRLLLPFDGAPSTAAAIGPAVTVAQRSGAELDVLYVVEPGGKCPEEPGTITTPRYIDQPQYEWPAWAKEFLDRFTALEGRPIGLPIRLFLRRGDPVVQILNLAAERQSDLIVLEWRGRLDPTHASIVKGVLREGRIPIMIIQALAASSDSGIPSSRNP